DSHVPRRRRSGDSGPGPVGVHLVHPSVDLDHAALEPGALDARPSTSTTTSYGVSVTRSPSLGWRFRIRSG
ncbi:MAG: hypothetical protein M3Q27_14410, partial [Actinomycetota bacterium]|nr:hypothetical protein [Actinomycetota bacterium]